VFDVAVSVDAAGILEYWGGARQDYKFPKCAKFDSKLDTDLFEFVKHKTIPFGLCFSPDGTKFATVSLDRKVKLFKFKFI
jgi:peptidylprolyl isomerase domain and WD repeat-containing protein 1